MYERKSQSPEFYLTSDAHHYVEARERVAALRAQLRRLTSVMNAAERLETFAPGSVDFEKVGIAVHSQLGA